MGSLSPEIEDFWDDETRHTVFRTTVLVARFAHSCGPYVTRLRRATGLFQSHPKRILPHHPERFFRQQSLVSTTPP